MPLSDQFPVMPTLMCWRYEPADGLDALTTSFHSAAFGRGNGLPSFTFYFDDEDSTVLRSNELNLENGGPFYLEKGDCILITHDGKLFRHGLDDVNRLYRRVG